MKRRDTSVIKVTYTDKIFDICNVIIMLILLVIFIYPLYFVLIASFSDPVAVGSGKVLLFPTGITFESYQRAFEYSRLWTGYANSIFYTVVGTICNLFFSVCFAYPLSNKEFMPRKILLALFLFTMYFSGGMIPTYLVVKQTHIMNTPWAMIIPGLVSVYNCLIVRSYFINSIPGDLKEAAELDGASAFQYLVKILLPLSKPVLAVVGLYYAVGHWNDYYNALLYLTNMELYPLQSVLRDLLMSTQSMAYANNSALSAKEMEILTYQSMLLKYSVIILASVPMLCIYPFIQKFFVKGMMVGSVKG